MDVDIPSSGFPSLVGFSTGLSGSISAMAHINESGSSVDLEISRLEGRLGNSPFEGGSLRGTWESSGKVKLFGSWDGVERTEFFADGRLFPRDSLDIDLKIQLSGDDPLLAMLLDGTGFGGVLEARGKLTGSWSKPGFDFSTRVMNIGYGDFDIEEAELHADVKLDGAYGVSGTAFLDAGKFRAGGLNFSEASIDLLARGRSLDIKQAYLESAGYSMHLDGSLAWENGGVRSLIDSLEVILANGESVCSGGITVGFDSAAGEVSFGPADLQFEGGSASITAGLDIPERALKVVTQATNLPLNYLEIPGSPSLGGRISFELSGESRIGEQPEINIGLTGEGCSVGKNDFDEIMLSLALKDGMLRIDRMQCKVMDGEMAVRTVTLLELRSGGHSGGRTLAIPPGEQMLLELDWQNLDLGLFSSLLGSGSLIKGSSTGSVFMRGKTDGPVIEGNAVIENPNTGGFVFDTADIEWRSISRDSTFVKVNAYAGDELSTANGTIPLSVNLSEAPYLTFPDSTALDLSIAGLDASFIAGLVREVEETAGNLDFAGQIVLSSESPIYLDGKIKVKDVVVAIAGVDDRVTGLTGEVEVGKNRWMINKMKGNFGSGRINLAGDLAVSGFKIQDTKLALKGKNIPVTWIRDFNGTADCSLSLTGLKNAFLTGKVDLKRGFLTKEFKKRESRKQKISKPRLIYDIELVVDQNLWLKNSEAEVELKGEALLNNRAGRLGMTGEFDIMKGKYFILRRNKFKVVRGRIEFLDPSRFDPVFDLEAETVIRERYRTADDEWSSTEIPITLVMTGPLSKIEYAFMSDDEPIPTEEVLMLLAFRKREAESAADLFDSGSLLADAGVFGATLLEEKFGEILDTVEIEPGENTIEETVVGLGKYVSDNLYLYYSQYLAAKPRSQIGFEYRLNKFFSLTGGVEEKETGREYNIDLTFGIEY